MELSDQTTPQPPHSLEASMPTIFAPTFQVVLKLLRLMQVVPSSVGRIPVSPVKSLTLSIEQSEPLNITLLPHQQLIKKHGTSITDSSHQERSIPLPLQLLNS